MSNETKRIIDIDETEVLDTRPTEIPQISIEKAPSTASMRDRRLPSRWIGAALFALFIAFNAYSLLLWPGANEWHRNKEILAAPYQADARGVDALTDTILDVAMDIYPLRGLRASLETEMPDTADRSLVLFMRSADYLPGGEALDPVYVDGIKGRYYKSNDPRDGYVVISPEGRPVIGVAESGAPDRWARRNAGSSFRQFVLLNDGQLPREFVLKGKVERAALAEMPDGDLYYVVTRNRESMYDFADALREFGFLQAVYITGGNAYSFSRDPQGHSRANVATRKKINKYLSQPLPQPLLVFRSQDSNAD